jgi:mannose PTS system EIIA component
MSNSVGIILVSHGDFAKAALKSAEMIVGKQENCIALSLTPEKGLDDLYEELVESYEQLDRSNGVLILTDINNGSPTNATIQLLLSKRAAKCIAGFNLPILLETLLTRNGSLENLKAGIMNTFSKTIICINDRLEK